MMARRGRKKEKAISSKDGLHIDSDNSVPNESLFILLALFSEKAKYQYGKI